MARQHRSPQNRAPTEAWAPRPEEAGPPGIAVDIRSARQRIIYRIAAAVGILLLAGLAILGYVVVTGGLHKRAAPNSGPAEEDGAAYASHTFENISRAALAATNDHRAFKGLEALDWHQGLASIAAQYAAEMAAGKAPFSHDGFDDRVDKYPMSSRRAAENLGKCRGHSNVARCAVNGWILSPEHEQNLAGDFNLCGIGTALDASSGQWFLTQLFADTR